MILFVFGLIVAVAGFCLLVTSGVVRTYKPAYRGSGLGGILLGVLLVLGSFYNTVGARSVGLPVGLGKVGSPLSPGIHWEPPWVHIVSCTTGEDTSIQNSDQNTGDALADQSVPISGSDQGGATADVTVNYHIDAADAVTVFRKYACNLQTIKANLIVQNVRSIAAQSATSFVSVDLKSHRSQIEQLTLKGLRADLAPYGITVDGVTLADLTLNQNVQAAANSKLAQQQAVATEGYKHQQAEVAAETAEATATGIAQSNKIKAASLTPAVLCADWIAGMGNASVINTAGPCSTAAATTPTPSSVLITPKAK